MTTNMFKKPEIDRSLSWGDLARAVTFVPNFLPNRSPDDSWKFSSELPFHRTGNERRNLT